MRSRGIAWESYEESETIYSVIIIINKAGRLETYRQILGAARIYIGKRYLVTCNTFIIYH